VDRVTILALKILVGVAAGKSVTHFETERERLISLLETQSPVKVNLLLELAAVNALLWQAEDTLRAMRGVPEPDLAMVATVAFRIQSLNDDRARVIAQINGADTPAEKL
jgi:hypothetical protein